MPEVAARWIGERHVIANLSATQPHTEDIVNLVRKQDVSIARSDGEAIGDGMAVLRETMLCKEKLMYRAPSSAVRGLLRTK